jgi:hypothetical protein
MQNDDKAFERAVKKDFDRDFEERSEAAMKLFKKRSRVAVYANIVRVTLSV